MARKKTAAAEALDQEPDGSTVPHTVEGLYEYSSHRVRSAGSRGQVAEPDNIILEHLRALRTDMAAMREDVREVKTRLTSVERSIAAMYADKAELNDRYDRIVRRIERIERIERRLEIAE